MSSSKDTAAMTAAVEMIVRKVILLLNIENYVLLTGTMSPINFYMAVFNLAL